MIGTATTAATLPPRCYAVLLSEDRLIQVVRGESGYHSMSRNGEPIVGEQARRLMRELNEELGITDWRVPEAMVCGSMFGWHCKAADPAAYPEKEPVAKR